MNIEVRRINPTDAENLRNCRLAALKDSPHAFGAKLSDEQNKPLSEFESDSQRLSSSDSTSMYLALSEESVYGQIGAFISSGKAYICAMWVSPQVRGRRVATRLLTMAFDWLVESGHTEVYAWVVDTNNVAISFYNSVGFKATTSKQVLPSNESLTETLYKLSKYS
ncbi:GNAT family N-acetyltransferase [Agarivorans sp. QJM3NY_33]|uniref:GNAT family N-acetyltransferase n=1 Tax=Agarivorans sp. QJM3NY_33 TaxID=3421432 RepID=UPI003D7D5A91